jgi:hypothetical protein
LSSQGIAYWEKRLSDNKEAEGLEKQSRAASDALWRTQQMLQSVMPNVSGRIID